MTAELVFHNYKPAEHLSILIQLKKIIHSLLTTQYDLNTPKLPFQMYPDKSCIILWHDLSKMVDLAQRILRNRLQRATIVCQLHQTVCSSRAKFNVKPASRVCLCVWVIHCICIELFPPIRAKMRTRLKFWIYQKIIAVKNLSVKTTTVTFSENRHSNWSTNPEVGLPWAVKCY